MSWYIDTDGFKAICPIQSPQEVQCHVTFLFAGKKLWRRGSSSITQKKAMNITTHLLSAYTDIYKYTIEYKPLYLPYTMYTNKTLNITIHLLSAYTAYTDDYKYTF